MLSMPINICPWKVLDEVQTTWLGSTLIFTGLIGAAVNGWLLTTFFLRTGYTTWSHLLLLSTSVASVGRGLLAGFPFQATSALAGRWLFGESCCQLFAFLHQLFGVGELLSVTLLAAERFWITRHRHIGNHTYVTGLALVWVAAVGWAFMPLFYIGRFGCDVSGTACGLDWRLVNRYQIWYNLSYLLFVIGLAVAVTIMSLLGAIFSSQSLFEKSDHDQHNITKAVLAMVICLYLLWLPQASIAVWRMLGLRIKIPALFALLAPIGSEVSSLVPTLSFLCYEPRMRCALLAISVGDDCVRLSTVSRNRRYGMRLTTVKR